MPGIFVLFVLFAVGAVIFGMIAERKRREELERVAASLGLYFVPGSDRNVGKDYRFLDDLRIGSSRMGSNRMRGTYRGFRVDLFDWRYVTGSGKEDIDFESAESSRRYTVRSKDKKFSYDFFHARLIQLFLDSPKVCLEVEQDVMALIVRGPAGPTNIRKNLDHLVAIRERMADYVLETSRI